MDYKDANKTECDVNCFFYGMFGGIGGCEAQDNGWGGCHEPIEPGEDCLYPDRKEFGKDLGVVSSLGLCAALEGNVIEGGNQDNTKFVRILIGEGRSKD